eukprot:9583394-Alexandrium_andersonii.AAC.1
MPIAPLLPACTRRRAEKPRSMAMEAIPTRSAAPFTMPANSASPELSAMVFCVVDQCLVICTPTHADPLHVDRRVRKHPATSVSTNVRISATSSCQGKL